MGCGGSKKKNVSVPTISAPKPENNLHKSDIPSPSVDSNQNRSKQPTVDIPSAESTQQLPQPSVEIRELIDVNPKIYEENAHRLYALKSTNDDEINECQCDDYINSQATSKKSSVIELLNKKPRSWVDEQIKLGIEGMSDTSKIPSFKQIRKPILLQQQFNQIIWAVGEYFFNNDELAIQAKESNQLPGVSSEQWLEGFEWNGIYIKLLLHSDQSTLKNEVQSIKYLSLEIQHHLAFNSLRASEQDATIIVGNMLLPLIAYTERNGLIIYGTPLIPKSDLSSSGNLENSLPQIGSKNDYSNVMHTLSPEYQSTINKDPPMTKRDALCNNRHLPLVSNVIKNCCVSLSSSIKSNASLIIGAYSCIPDSIFPSIIYLYVPIDPSKDWIILDSNKFDKIVTKELAILLDYKGAKKSVENFQKFYKQFYGWSTHIIAISDESLPVNRSVEFFTTEKVFRGNCLVAMHYYRKGFKKCYNMINDNAIETYEMLISDLISKITSTDAILSHMQLKDLMHRFGLNMRFEWVILELLKKESLQKNIIASDILIRVIKHLAYSEIETKIKHSSVNTPISKKADISYSEYVNDIFTKIQCSSLNCLTDLHKALTANLLKSLPMFKHFIKTEKSINSLISELYKAAIQNPLVLINGMQHHFKLQVDSPIIMKIATDAYYFYKDGIPMQSCRAAILRTVYPFTFNEFAYLMLAIYMNQKIKSILTTTTTLSPILPKRISHINKKAVSNIAVGNNENKAKLTKEPSFTFRCNGPDTHKKFSCDITNSLNQSGISPQKIVKLSKNILRTNKNIVANRKKCTESVILEKTIEMPFPSLLYGSKPDDMTNSLLKQSYYIPSPDTINDWVEYLQNIAADFHTFEFTNTAMIEAEIIQMFCVAFLLKDIKRAQSIWAKVNEKALQMPVIPKGLEITISIAQAILNESPDNIKESINMYSQCIANCLKLIGDPRGKGNYSFALLLLPLWRYLRYVSFDKRLQEKEFALELLEAVELNLNNKRKSLDDCMTTSRKLCLPFQQWYSENANLSPIYDSFPDNNKTLLSWIFTNLPYYFTSTKEDTIPEDPTSPTLITLPPIVSSKKGQSNDLSIKLTNEGVILNKSYTYSTAYVWGSNYRGQLAINSDEDVCVYLPKIVMPLKDLYIKQVCCGHSYSLAVTDSDEVYSWGENEFGQLGFGNSVISIREPQKIIGLTNISKVSCGSEHSVALTNSKTIYIWGQNQGGILGTGFKDPLLKPTLVPKLNDIKDVVCGGLHTIAIGNNGLLYSWGKGEGGQLGHDSSILNEEFAVVVPTIIEKLKEIFIIEVACGEAHSVALSKDGNLYGWGYTNYGQLGLGISDDTFQPGTGNTESKVDTPVIITIPENKIEHIYCGYTFTLMLNDKGSLIGCGSNDLGQLGIEVEEREVDIKYQCNGNPKPKTKDILAPAQVEALENIGIKNLSCGENHSLAISKDGLVLAWGAYNKGQLGLGEVKKYSTPRPLQCLSGSIIQEVSCGACHSMALVGGKRESIPKYAWEPTVSNIVYN